jgi:hypothetical protein
MITLFRLLFGKRRSAEPRNPLLLYYLDDFNAPKHARYAEIARF